MADDFQLFTSLRFDPALLEVPNSGPEHAGWNRRNASPLYMLDFHRDRILRAATHWGWDAAVEVLAGETGLARLGAFITAAVVDPTTPKRVKVVVSRAGSMTAEVSQVPEVPLRNLFPVVLPSPGSSPDENVGGYQLPSREGPFSVVTDHVQTPKSEFTHFKTTNRAMYDTARERAVLSLADPKEVLLVNASEGSIMEGSLTTPYLWRDGRWVTPPVKPTFSLEDSGGQDGTTRRWALER